ncbi:MAG: FAD/NAD(P)-binding protein [Deferribacterales bacterium]
MRIPLKKSGYEVIKAEVIKITPMTATEKLYEIKLKNGENLDHDPGQFVEVSIFGAGEAPISVCSSPTNQDTFELCIRKAGRMTSVLHNLKAGDEIGIRGPFGVGFPVNLLKGRDMIFIAGGLGIAPLRSLINYVLDERRDFGKVDILLGCKTPDKMLFGTEVAVWAERMDVNFCCTVDKSDPEWKGNVGLITTLIPGVNFNPDNTFAVVCGPPEMYIYVIQELLKKGMPENRIYVSLERHMKCGMGRCGHCQIHQYYCCMDGPVFPYDKVKDLEGAI